MPYEPELAADAEEVFDALPRGLQIHLIHELYTLADAPTRLSRATISPPEPRGYQAYDFTCVEGDLVYGFTILFRYSGDETRIVVELIEYRQRD